MVGISLKAFSFFILIVYFSSFFFICNFFCYYYCFQTGTCDIVRVLAMLISLIRLLIVQNSEGIILSRLTQIDPSFVRSCFSLHDSTEDFAMKTKQNENTSSVYLSTYLVYMVKIAIESCIEIVSRITSDASKASNIMRLTELYFMEMIFLAKSGRF